MMPQEKVRKDDTNEKHKKTHRILCRSSSFTIRNPTYPCNSDPNIAWVRNSRRTSFSSTHAAVTIPYPTATVWFYVDGGSYVPSEIVTIGDTATEPEPPTKDDYVFVRWKTANGSAFDFSKPITEDITLIAAWADPNATFLILGQTRTYDPKKATTLQLLQGGTVVQTITVAAEATGQGQQTQPFTFEDVVPGTYQIVVTKAAHTSFTINNVLIGHGNLDLKQNSRSDISTMTMRCGDAVLLCVTFIEQD
jgi:hypothetical protein